MSTRYPGQRPRRSRAATVAVALVMALAAGVVLGWVLFHSDSSRTTAAKAPLCPDSRTNAMERARAAACLLDAYLALAGQPLAVRNERLADVVLPSQLATERTVRPTFRSAPVNPPGQPTKYAKITAEYASVVAVKPGTQLRPGAYEQPDVGYTAWIVTVDSYADSSAPLSNWYLGHFAIRWQHGRWWLADGFSADKNATPTSYTGGPENTAFGPGWVKV